MANNNGSKSGLDGLSEQAFEIAKRRQAAAIDVVSMLEDRYETLFASHAGTVLRACAWLAGTSLYRSFGLPDDMPPGTPVLSDRSNEEGLKMLKVFMFLVDKDGIKLKPDDYSSEIPAEQTPKMAMLQVQEEFQARYNEIMQQNGFDFADGTRTGAVACARLVKLHCINRKDLEAAVAVSTVSMGFVEGSKTVPANLKK